MVTRSFGVWGWHSALKSGLLSLQVAVYGTVRTALPSCAGQQDLRGALGAGSRRPCYAEIDGIGTRRSFVAGSPLQLGRSRKDPMPNPEHQEGAWYERLTRGAPLAVLVAAALLVAYKL